MTNPAGPEWTSAAWSRHGWRIHGNAAGEAGAADGATGAVVGGTGVPGGGTGAARRWTGAAATIPELAAASARRVPDRVAVSMDGQPVSHGQLDAQARQAAAWLAGRLGRGERMLLAAGTGPGFLRWYLGALRAGVIVVLANPAYTPAELGHLVADSGARLAVADPGPAGGWARRPPGCRSWRREICPAICCRRLTGPSLRPATSRCSPTRPAPPGGPKASR